jgi:hypothetical protein
LGKIERLQYRPDGTRFDQEQLGCRAHTAQCKQLSSRADHQIPGHNERARD